MLKTNSPSEKVALKKQHRKNLVAKKGFSRILLLFDKLTKIKFGIR
jgi:hypothetical protein